MAAETCSDISSAGSCPSLRVCRPVMRQKRSPDVSAGAKEREEKKKGSVIIMGLRTKPHRFASLRGVPFAGSSYITSRCLGQRCSTLGMRYQLHGRSFSFMPGFVQPDGNRPWGNGRGILTKCIQMAQGSVTRHGKTGPRRTGHSACNPGRRALVWMT